MINITIDKDEYIAELEKVLGYFYEAKTIGDIDQIKYFQGMSKGLIFMLKKLDIVNEIELATLVKDAELDIPSIYRT